jgi:cardiolipin synthase
VRLGRRGLLALGAAATLQGCASVPDIDDYLPPVTDDPLQRHYALQASLPDSPLVFGNQTRLLRDGAQAFPAMFEAMRAAHDHINLEYFTFEDIEFGGLRLSDLLIGKLNQGVAVNIIYDGYGSLNTSSDLFDRLRKAGAAVVEFNPLDPVSALAGHSLNDRDHRKIMIVDGRIGIIGGINLARCYENPPSAGVPADGDMDKAYWRDTAMDIRGPVIARLQTLFFQTWKQQNGGAYASAKYFPSLPREGVQTIRIIGSVPGDNQPLYYVALERALRAAQHRIWVSSGYFTPPHQEREDLGKAARNGLDVRIAVPSHSDVESAVYAARAAYGDLLKSGARIYEIQNAVLHSKLATVDGVWTAIGSSNLDRRSVVFNNEVDAIIVGFDTATQVEAVLRGDMSASREVSDARWEQRSLNERVDEWKARLWEYWM